MFAFLMVAAVAGFLTVVVMGFVLVVKGQGFKPRPRTIYFLGQVVYVGAAMVLGQFYPQESGKTMPMWFQIWNLAAWWLLLPAVLTLSVYTGLRREDEAIPNWLRWTYGVVLALIVLTSVVSKIVYETY